MIDVCLLGTGGTMPLPQRALTSLCLRYNGSLFLTDCGEGTQVQLRKSGFSMHDIDVILITHFHADHVTGLQGLLLSMSKSERKQPVEIIAPQGARHIINALCITAPAMPFDVRITELTKPNEHFSIKGLDIQAQLAEHSVICYAYSFTLHRSGKFDPKRAIEAGIDVCFWRDLQNGQSIEHNGRLFTPDMVLGSPRKGIKVTYCTDTRPTASLAALAKDSDLFICEGMYADEDKQQMTKEKKHMTFAEAAWLAKKANADTLWLTHFSPSLSDPYAYEKYAASLFENTLIPHDLEQTILTFSARR